MSEDVIGTRERFVDSAREQALGGPASQSPADRAEVAWERNHGAGHVAASVDHTRLLLWNFAVGSADIKPEHQAFLTSAMNLWIGEPVSIGIEGATSRTGSETRNSTLSEHRAQAVAAVLERMGFEIDSTSGAGEHDAGDTSNPQQMAMERAVTIHVTPLAKLTPPPLLPEMLDTTDDSPPDTISDYLTSLPGPGAHTMTIRLLRFTKQFPGPVVILMLDIQGVLELQLAPAAAGDLYGKGAMSPTSIEASLEKRVTDEVRAAAKISTDGNGRYVFEIGGTYRPIPELGVGTGLGTQGGYMQFEVNGPFTVNLGGDMVTGKLQVKVTVRALPGPVLIKAAADTGLKVGRGGLAALGTPAGPWIAGAVGSVVFSGALARMLDSSVREAQAAATAATERRAFAAVFARLAVGEAGHADFADDMNGLDNISRSSPHTSEAAEIAVARALLEIINAPDRAALPRALAERYAVKESDGTPDTSYAEARRRIYLALGGDDGGDVRNYSLRDLLRRPVQIAPPK